MSDFDGVPPHDTQAEQCALGGMLLLADAIADVTAVIGPQDHYRPAHQMIHEAITGLYEAGLPADVVAVADAMSKSGTLEKAGGALYLHTLIAAVPHAAQAGYYAQIVRERAVLRRIIEAGTRVVQMGYGGGEADEIAERARQEIDEATAAGVQAPAAQSIRNLVYEVLDEQRGGTERGLALPWLDLTEALNGLAPGQLVYVAARPGIGKSIIGMMAAAHVAMKLGRPALLVSMEMRAREITQRLISAKARVPLTSLLRRSLTDGDWDRIARYAEAIAGSKLAIHDPSRCSVADIRSLLREMARTDPAAVLVVDYLGLLDAPKAENRNQAVAQISRDLKQIAGEYNIPVLCLAQLNRGPEMRSDHRPVAADLRDSGAQEQDADVILLLHREDAYDRESPRAGELDVIVAKNRTGPQCTVTLAFQGHYARAVDMARGGTDSWEWEESA